MLNFYEDEGYDSDRSLDFRERLRDLLEDEQFRRQLKGRLRASKRALAARSNDDPTTIPEIVNAHTWTLRQEGPQLFELKVIAKLPKPHAVVASDLVASARHYVAGAAFEDSEWTVAYTRFVQSVFGKLFDSLDQEFAFNDWNDWEVLRTFSPHQADHIYDLWASKTGFDVKLKLTFHRGRDELKNQLWIMSTGFCAEDAFKNFHEQVERVVPLILNCCRRAYAADRNAEWFVQFEKELESLVGGSFGDQRSNESEDGADPDSANSQTEPLLFDERNFVSACLDSYFHDEDDELNERIRSSLQFLIQGTQQDSDAMKLVLFVGALEALICEGDHGIGGQLSRNIAALLQPNGIDRSAAMRGLEKLYKHRSSAAHRLAQPPDAESKRALDIASASLRAILEWRRHQELMELPVKWCELRAQLRDASETGRQMVGPTRNLGSLIGPAPQIDN